MTDILIQHWHRQYCASPEHAQACESMARQTVIDAMSVWMSHLWRNLDEVLVIREVNLKLTVDARAYSDVEIAELWGRSMAIAIVEAAERGDTELIRRFPNRVEHLAAFLQNDFEQNSEVPWYFARFQQRLRPEIDSRFDDILLESMEDWPDLVVKLSAMRLLARVLSGTSHAVSQRLWVEGIRGIQDGTDVEAQRPLLRVALKVLKAIFQTDWSAAQIAKAESLFLAQTQPATDWSDPTHLSEAVFVAIRFLSQHLVPSPALPRLDAASPIDPIEVAVRNFDWLDVDWLVKRLQKWIVSPSDANSATKTIHRRSSKLQREWTVAWQRVIERYFEQRDHRAPLCSQNKTLALCLIAEQCAQWIHDPALAVFVEAILEQEESKGGYEKDLPSNATTFSLGEHASPTETTDSSRAADDLKTTSEMSSSQWMTKSHDPRDLATQNSAPARRDASLSLQPGSNRARKSVSPTSAKGGVGSPFPFDETEYAGCFLLLRSIQDLRVPTLARQACPTDVPLAASAYLLFELAERWTISGNRIGDQGLMQFCHMFQGCRAEDVLHVDLFRTAFSVEIFQASMTQTLVQQRIWTKPHLHLSLCRPTSDTLWILGGSLETGMVPYSLCLGNGSSALASIEMWIQELERAFEASVVVSTDEALAELMGKSAWEVRDTRTHSESAWIGLNTMEPSSLESTFACTAALVIRHWSRWLKGMQNATSQYILDQFIRRRGRIRVQKNRTLVVLEQKPMDVVLQVSGALAPLEYFDGKEMKQVVFQTVGAWDGGEP